MFRWLFVVPSLFVDCCLRFLTFVVCSSFFFSRLLVCCLLFVVSCFFSSFFLRFDGHALLFAVYGLPLWCCCLLLCVVCCLLFVGVRCSLGVVCCFMVGGVRCELSSFVVLRLFVVVCYSLFDVCCSL